MDLAKFGFSRRPFRPTPDTDLYCASDESESAFVAVQRAFACGHGAAVVDGEPGVGKTLLGLRFLESLSQDTQRVILHTPPSVKPSDFFQAVLFDMGKPYQGLSEQELRLAVHGELLTALGSDRPVVILVDEAHHLTPQVLEEIRLFGNLESKHTKAVFGLLVGRPGVRDVIAQTSGTGFEQRLGVQCRLAPLDRDEAVRFIRHQIRECGGRPEWVISDEALTLIADHCRGIPRMLNRTAGVAFEIAATAGCDAVDAEAVHEALTQLDLPTGKEVAVDDTAPTLLPLHPHRDGAQGGGNPPDPIQLRRPSRTTQQGPAKKTKRKTA